MIQQRDVERATALLRDTTDVAEEILDQVATIRTLSGRYVYLVDVLEKLAGSAARSSKYLHEPVGVREFVESDKFLNKKGVLWPEVMRCLEELAHGQYEQMVATGGIGTAKTTLALYAIIYELYKMLSLRDPHAEFGGESPLDPSTEIVLIFQSIRERTARGVDFNRFKSMVEMSPWFRKNAPFDPRVESELRFPRKIRLRPISALETAAIGENVFGGIIDEINYMALIDKSSRVVGGGLYDQAQAAYQAIARRRESRFMHQGDLPGLLCVVSSSKYPGEFTERKKAEARVNPRIYVYDKRVWDVKPKGTFTDERFRVFVGHEARSPRVIEPDEEVPERDAPFVIEVPAELEHEFRTNIYDALRDIAGVANRAQHPLIASPEVVRGCFGNHESIFSAEWCDFETAVADLVLDNVVHPGEPRYAHVDLGLTGDSAGVSVGHVPFFVPVVRGEDEEVLPVIFYDGHLEVRAPPGGQISFEDVRSVFYALREEGVDLRWVSYDSWQSTDSLQILKAKGFKVGTVSMDKTSVPYDVLKQAALDGRVRGPAHEKAQRELSKLEYDRKTGKVDHPPQGSKDLSDAMAGVAYGLTMRRAIWARHKVPVSKRLEEAAKKAGGGGGKD